MKPIRLFAAAAILALAACSQSATEPAATAAPPSFDGGNSMGSGNDSGEDSGSTMGFDSDAGGGTTQSDTTGRGGNGMGSGN